MRTDITVDASDSAMMNATTNIRSARSTRSTASGSCRDCRMERCNRDIVERVDDPDAKEQRSLSTTGATLDDPRLNMRSSGAVLSS